MDARIPLILVVDDDPSLCEILVNILTYHGHRAESAGSGEEALARLRRGGVDLVLLDLKLPDSDGLSLLAEVRALQPPVAVVMVSGEGSIRTALKAVEMGAFDFLEKPLNPDRVLLTLRNALERRRLEAEKETLLRSMREQYTMVGEGPAMNAVRDLILKAARTHSKVLIEGENGTGKELVARAIHHSGAKADRPFVPVNCAAIPEALIESELFGHRKGAFTGAVADRIGRFQAADGGTLFLDEIGDMSLMTQAKVLRVIETEAFERVGSNQTLSVDVRLVSATNQDLRAAMEAGRFREDLFFRINVLNIRMPPLRERPEDIPALVAHYVRYFCHEHGIRHKTVTGAALGRLSEYGWPGNVRELRNFTEKLVVLVERETVGPDDVSVLLREAGPPVQAGVGGPLTLREAKERFEREFIREGLAAEKWNVTRAADRLGIPRTYLHKKIRQMGIGS